MVVHVIAVDGNQGDHMKVIILSILAFLISLPLRAEVSLPANFVDLHGAFKGKGLTSKKDAYLLVYRIVEDGQSSGRFFVYLLSDNKTKGQIFDAEWIGGEGIGLLANGKSQDAEFLDPKLPAAAVLEKGLDRKQGQVLNLNRQNNSPLISESYMFNYDSDTVQISNVPPLGLYADKKDQVTATQGYEGTLNVVALAPSIGLSDKYVGVFELDGVVVLRKQVLDNSLLSYNEGAISGILVSVKNGRKQEVIVGQITADGRPSTVKVLRRDQ
jgi:hypothetical protein